MLGGVFGDADAKARPLLHALEDEVDAVGLVPGHAALPGQDMVFLAHALLGPFDRNAMIAGEGVHPVLVAAARPSRPLRKSTGRLATTMRTPAGTAIMPALARSAAPAADRRRQTQCPAGS